jgi:tyrosine-protein kinase Etk/Wzc
MQRWGVVSLDEETRTLMDQMATLEAQRDANEIEIRSMLTTLASYKTQIDQQEKSIAKSIGEASDPYIRLLQEQLAQLEVQRDITVAQNPSLAKQGVNNERLREIDGQIADLRQRLRDRTQEYVANILPSGEQANLQQDPTGYLKQIKQKFLETQISIQTYQAKRDAMNEALRPYERRFASVPGKTIEFARLTREKSSLEQLYALLETKFNEANVTEQSEFGYVEIFDPAVAPAEPSSPNLLLNIALGVILGLGMGLAFTFIKELLEQRVYSPEDLIRRGLVPLSTIGSLNSRSSVRTSDAYQVAMANPSSGFTEAFRHLRTNLYSTRNVVPPRTIMVTSPNPGEGKTTIACNLAVILAQSGKKVLLVDADLRDPAVHKAFGMDAKTGLAQILTGKMTADKLIRASQVPNLSVLCSGSSPINAAELLESSDMKFLVNQLSEQYDVVLFDSPPVLAVSDALILSMLVQSVLLVVSAGVTTSTAIERATESLSKIGANMVGLVLNNFDLTRAYGFLSAGSGYGYYGYAERYGRNGSEGKREEKKKEMSRPGVA